MKEALGDKIIQDSTTTTSPKCPQAKTAWQTEEHAGGEVFHREDCVKLLKR